MISKRELMRWWQQWQRQDSRSSPERQASLDAARAAASALPWLDRLRWMFLPLLLTGVIAFAGYQLSRLTVPQNPAYTPVILDAPLTSPYQLQWSSPQKGRYFLLRSQGFEGRFVALSPSVGTRAFRGKDAVPMFGARLDKAEVIPSRCSAAPGEDDVLFFTHDGMILWLCQNPQEEQKFEMRRLGWRFANRQWDRGLTLGRSASNDIVLGSAILPAHSLRLKRVGNRLRIASYEDRLHLPDNQRLVCVQRTPPNIAPPELSNPPASTTSNDSNSSKESKTPNLSRASTPPKTSVFSNPTPLPTCQWASFYLEPGQYFQLHSRNHPEHAITFRWQTTEQEKTHQELWLSPANGRGLSLRQMTLPPSEDGPLGFWVGNAEAYFQSLLPDAVRTQDLDALVHELLLRDALAYVDPNTLRKTLTQRYHQAIDLEKLSQDLPAQAWISKLNALEHNRYLRNRIWMANHSLAQNARLQARTLFRLRFGNAQQPGELLGLGAGGSTLRAPRRNIIQIHTRQNTQALDLRLATTFTARDVGTPYIQRLDETQSSYPLPILLLDSQPTELIVAAEIPEAAYTRAFQLAPAITHARTALWVKETLYHSHNAYTYQAPQTIQPTPAPNALPAHFLYDIKRRWWERTPGLQRSSKDWPVRALAAQLGTLLTQERLAEDLKQRNPKRWQTRKHCGNESRRVDGRWRHKQQCWGEVALFESNTQILVPCSDLLRSKLKEQFCKPGTQAPQIDASGRPVLPTLEQTQGLPGIVFLPHPPPAHLPNALPTHRVQVLPGSGPVYLDEHVLQPGISYPLRHQAKLRVGALTFQYIRPTGVLAFARYRGEFIAPQYPEGPTFAHAMSGGVGGPFRMMPKDLQAQLPPPAFAPSPSGLRSLGTATNPQANSGQPGATSPTANTPNSSNTKTPVIARKIATTLSLDLQRIAFATASQHFARLDSPAFQKQFRRRYLKNPHKPHAGAVVILNRKNGQLLANMSFPTFDPNLPPLQSQRNEDQRTYRYLRGQIIDRYGFTDALLAYPPSKLPPNPPQRQRLQGRPSLLPHYLEALEWDREEGLRGLRADARSGWLLERGLSGAQVPGSTAKIVTAIAYSNYLRKQGKPVRFPTHNCAGGIMFLRERRMSRRNTPKMSTSGTSQWRPSRLRFRCHHREGHGQLDLKGALAASCNVYFAKLALEMAGVPRKTLLQGEVQWLQNRYGGQGRYQSLRVPRDAISQAMRNHPIHRTLFRTAGQLGFAMRYSFREEKRKFARYTDVFWEPGMSKWPRPSAQASPTQRLQQQIEAIQARRRTQLSDGFFGKGRYFGNANAYPAWQQWVHNAAEPRYGHSVSVAHEFGSTDASLRAMAYIGFGQNLLITPLRMALIAGAVANGGWLPLPQLWLGDWDPRHPKASPQLATAAKRPPPRRVIHAQDALLIREAMAAVTTQGTASLPFAALNRQCLQPLGLQLIGKTGTAETRSQRARHLLLEEVKRAGPSARLPADRKWFQQSGCYRRRFWKHYYPEENVADSLFVGTLVSTSSAAAGATPPPTQRTWALQDLAFAVVVKNGYHPEGAVCRQKGVDLDRSEAKYVVHDMVLQTLQHLGYCRDYKDTSKADTKLVLPPHLRKRRRIRRIKRSRTRAPKGRRTVRPRRKRRKSRRSRRRTRPRRRASTP